MRLLRSHWLCWFGLTCVMGVSGVSDADPRVSSLRSAAQPGPALGAAARAGIVMESPGVGAEVFLQVIPKLQLGFDATQAWSSIPRSSNNKPPAPARVDFRGETIGGYARYFISDSFNLKGGIAHQRLVLTPAVANRDHDQPRSFLESEAIVLQAGIGQRWRLPRGLLIGIDWIGTSYPLAPLRRHGRGEGLHALDANHDARLVSVTHHQALLDALVLSAGVAF